MTLPEVIIIGLAGWRVASLFVQEDGPWDVFERVRARAGLGVGEVSGFWPSLLSCVWCASVWTTLAAWALWQVGIEEPVVVLAAMAAAVIANRATQ